MNCVLSIRLGLLERVVTPYITTKRMNLHTTEPWTALIETEPYMVYKAYPSDNYHSM